MPINKPGQKEEPKNDNKDKGGNVPEKRYRRTCDLKDGCEEYGKCPIDCGDYVKHVKPVSNPTNMDYEIFDGRLGTLTMAVGNLTAELGKAKNEITTLKTSIKNNNNEKYDKVIKGSVKVILGCVCKQYNKDKRTIPMHNHITNILNHYGWTEQDVKKRPKTS